MQQILWSRRLRGVDYARRRLTKEFTFEARRLCPKRRRATNAAGSRTQFQVVSFVGASPSRRSGWIYDHSTSRCNETASENLDHRISRSRRIGESYVENMAEWVSEECRISCPGLCEIVCTRTPHLRGYLCGSMKEQPLERRTPPPTYNSSRSVSAGCRGGPLNPGGFAAFFLVPRHWQALRIAVRSSVRFVPPCEVIRQYSACW